MKKMLYVILGLFLLIPELTQAQLPTPRENKPFSATIIEVLSGDMIVFDRNNSKHILRLDGVVGIPSEIDRFGARKYLESILLNKKVNILTLGGIVSENDNETLFGDIYLDNKSVKQMLVETGYAMVPNLDGSNPPNELLILQAKAQEASQGVWSDLSNPYISEWKAQVCGDSAVTSQGNLDLGYNFAAQGSTEIGWGSLGKTCSRWETGWECKKKWGVKFCWPTLTVRWAEQRWYLYKDESFEWSTINQQWLESLMQEVGFDPKVLITPVPVLKDTFVSSLKTVAGQCALEGIAAAGISSFYTSPAAAFTVWSSYTLNCVSTRGPAAITAAIAAKLTGVPKAEVLIEALKKASFEYLDKVIRGTSFRITTKCLW